MSQEDVEVVRSALTAANRGDREAALRFVHPAIVIDATRRAVNPTTYVGVEGVRRWFAERSEVWEDFRLEPVELIDAHDRVLVIGRLVGKGKASGAMVGQPVRGLWTVRHGRIVRGEIGYAHRREALEAAGLRE
jgi:ketosteroid isomerase-like protein